MKITIDTNEPIGRLELAIVRDILDSVDLPEPKATKKAAPKKAVESKPKAEETVITPDQAREHLDDHPEQLSNAQTPEEPNRMDEAVKKATELVGNGEAAKVKAALEKAGAKRVSELSGDQVSTFLEAL